MTIAEMNAAAAHYGIELDFQSEGTSQEQVWVMYNAGEDDQREEREWIEYDEYQGYHPTRPLGIWAKISADTEKLAHGFRISYAVDGHDVDGVSYDDLGDALKNLIRYEREMQEAE